MKYVSLDIETTGLDVNNHQILMLSMVVEDTAKKHIPTASLPHFTVYITHTTLVGNPYALAMNAWILDIISGRKAANYPVVDDTDVWIDAAIEFLNEHFEGESITVAGKNVAGFDLRFLPVRLKEKFKHRVIDAGTLFVDFNIDKVIPDLSTVKSRAGIDTPVAHDAREDALDVIKVLRTKY